MTTRYVPERGHIIWIDFDPQTGHEQAGRRPALVISPTVYNSKVGLALIVPVTSHAKGYPFEVEIPPGQPVSGVILADQVRSSDWKVRRCKYICQLPDSVLSDVLEKIRVLL